MPEQEPSGLFRSGYVALIGAPNVGKSTLLNQFLKEKISITAPKPQTTRNRILGILTEPGCQVVFVDTPGIHNPRDQFNRVLVDTALSTLSEVDTVCFLVDPTEGGREVNEFILQNLKTVKSPLILAINKIDLVRDKGMLLPIIQKYSSLLPFEAVIPISALTGDGVDELLNEIMRLLPEGPRYFPEDYLTDQPERFFVAEIVREKIFRLLRDEVPYSVAVAVDKFSEEQERNFIHIEATINVERDSQKAIIIGKKGQMLKEIGSQARRDIEVLLGCRVFLGLFVRVQKNWRKDRRAIQEFGYSSRK